MPKTILHLTDMHIINPHDSQELLGLNYKEYVTKFIEQLKENDFLPDCIIATGDFVDKGKINNFYHSREILIFLAKELNLTNEKVAVCCGDQDIILSEDKIGKSEDARKPFNEFSQSFINKNPIIKNERASLCKLSEGLFILLLDATLGSKGENKPGILSNKESDEIIRDFIIDKLDEDALLLVGTHYPLTASVSHFLTQEPAWIDGHFLKGNAGKLYSRITDLRASKQTLWVCGDIHYPEHVMLSKSSCFVSTGRFGHSRGLPISSQGKVIRVYNTQKTPHKILTIQYKTIDFADNNYCWQSIFSFPRLINENYYSETRKTLSKTKADLSNPIPKKTIVKQEDEFLELDIHKGAYRKRKSEKDIKKTNLTIFISSTCHDLRDIRSYLNIDLIDRGLSVIASDIEDSDFKVIGGKNSIEISLENVARCDILILLFDKRYGPPIPGYKGKSATHLEYDKARGLEIPILTFCRDDFLKDHFTWQKMEKKYSATLISKALIYVDTSKKNKKYGFESLFRFFNTVRRATKYSKNNWFDEFEKGPELTQLILRRINEVAFRDKKIKNSKIIDPETILLKLKKEILDFLIGYASIEENNSITFNQLHQIFKDNYNTKDIKLAIEALDKDDYIIFETIKNPSVIKITRKILFEKKIERTKSVQ